MNASNARVGSGLGHSAMSGSMSGLPESRHGWAIYEYATSCGNLVVLAPGPESPPAKCRDESDTSDRPRRALSWTDVPHLPALLGVTFPRSAPGNHWGNRYQAPNKCRRFRRFCAVSHRSSSRSTACRFADFG
jgi:hypothetical protein